MLIVYLNVNIFKKTFSNVAHTFKLWNHYVKPMLNILIFYYTNEIACPRKKFNCSNGLSKQRKENSEVTEPQQNFDTVIVVLSQGQCVSNNNICWLNRGDCITVAYQVHSTSRMLCIAFSCSVKSSNSCGKCTLMHYKQCNWGLPGK